ncbi:MAG: alpha/beta hydrolase [Dehalococcoidia bacterium]|nr:alpha/beta hydrolase [Dehalococcoidia bacterium]
MAFADLGEVRLFYTDDGENDPPIVLVHGWTCDSHDWSWQIPALAAGHRVVAYDQRGHGRSSAPSSGYRPRTLANDLAALLKRIDLPPVVAVGHSLGGAVVSALAVEHPDAVRAIVPVDPAYGVARETAEALLLPLLEAIKEDDNGHQAALSLFAQMYTPASPAGLRTWHERRVLGCPHHVLWQVLDGLFASDDQFGVRPQSDAYLARRACPVLSFHADPAHAAWEAGVFRHPYSKAIGWEGSGHFLHQERPLEFNAILQDWITGLP